MQLLRERIVEIADDLYNAHGIQAVGMDQLRAATGLSLKRLYSEFGSKEAIVAAVLDRRHDSWTSAVAARVDDAPDARSRLLAVYDYLADWFDTSTFRGCGFINAFGELGGVSPAVTESARAHKQSFQTYVAGLVADLGGTPDLAAQLALLAEGAQTTAAISGTSDAAASARRAAETLIDFTPRPTR